MSPFILQHNMYDDYKVGWVVGWSLGWSVGWLPHNRSLPLTEVQPGDDV